MLLSDIALSNCVGTLAGVQLSHGALSLFWEQLEQLQFVKVNPADMCLTVRKP